MAHDVGRLVWRQLRQQTRCCVRWELLEHVGRSFVTHLLEDVRGFVRIERRDQPGGRLLVDGLEDVGRVVRVRFGERSPMFLMLLEVLLGLAWSAASQVSQREGQLAGAAEAELHRAIIAPGRSAACKRDRPAA